MRHSVQSESIVIKCWCMDWTKRWSLTNQGGREKGVKGWKRSPAGCHVIDSNSWWGIGLNYPRHPPLIILVFFPPLFPASIFSKKEKEKPWRCSFFSVDPFTSVWGLGIKRKPVLKFCHPSNVLKLFNYIVCLTNAFIHRTQGGTPDTLWGKRTGEADSHTHKKV